jgi:hypothetical protein
LTPAASPYAVVDLQVFADFDSIAPRALQATLGKAASGDTLAIYVDQLSLADGAVFGAKVSSQEVRRTDIGATRVCSPRPSLVSTANAVFAVSWVQLNAAGNGCDLVINGTAVNSSGVDVLQSAVSGGIGVYSAVWQEGDAGNVATSRLRFAQLGPTAGTPWTTPAPIDATYGNAPSQAVLGMARGPGNTLAVVWEPCEGTAAACTTSVRLVSKFVAGAWTTKSIGRSLLIVGVAIDAAGEGVLLAVGESCPGGACTELSAYRF